jgi:hypothetical protein
MRGRTFAKSGHPARPCICLFVCLCVLPPYVAVLLSVLRCLFVCLPFIFLSIYVVFPVRSSFCLCKIYLSPCHIIHFYHGMFISRLCARLSIYINIHLSISMLVPIYLSGCSSLCVCVRLFGFHPFIHRLMFVSVHLFAYSSLCMRMCISVHVCPFIHLFIFFTLSFRMLISTLVCIFSH